MTRLLSLSQLSLKASQNTLCVTGDVGMDAAAELAAAGKKWLQATEQRDVAFDFNGVHKASSAVISVLFEWMRTCQSRSITVNAVTLSAPLERLALLSEIESLIHPPTLAR
ncbi:MULTISPECIES: STAS domain-containing protein [Halomonas]|uniref:STAS domain-containing protein n=1 Tax=Halomonas TaxID=2745 RepID=UPI000EEF4046|nr:MULTISPECIES: STAS domain-containing protein [Halomonas]HCR97662.1 anti-anti-sigma factor [Halomonas sp.]